MSCEKLMLTSEIKAVGIIKNEPIREERTITEKTKDTGIHKDLKEKKKAINQILSRVEKGEESGVGGLREN